ncbi:MAG: sulfotransferase [Anaerolineales bacterium]
MSASITEQKRSFKKRFKLRLNKAKRRYAGRFGKLPCGKKWVFIVSCTNSGSTVLHELLAAQPEIASMRFEGQNYQDQLPRPAEEGTYRLWALTPKYRLDENSDRDIDVGRIKRQWMSFMNDASREFYLEKSPPNAVRTRWLQKHFPEAYFIGLIRNGYAVAEGLARRVGVSIEDAGRQWNACVDTMLGDFEHLERKTLVRYEDLIADPNAVVADILSWLSVSRSLEPVQNREYRIHGQSQAVKDSMNERSIRSLSEKDLEVVESVARDNLARFAYLRKSAPLVA